MVSMKDISVRCGVSVATVSKALNDHSDISEATKRMVRNCAQEMGYFPNSSARALKTNRTFNLGVLFVDRARNGLTQDYFAKILDSFKVAAEEKAVLLAEVMVVALLDKIWKARAARKLLGELVELKVLLEKALTNPVTEEEAVEADMEVALVLEITVEAVALVI